LLHANTACTIGTSTENGMNQQHSQESRIAYILMLAALGTYMIVALIEAYFHDWKTVAALCGGSIALAVPFWLLKSGHSRTGNLLLMVIVLATITTAATVGQGIRDLAVIAYPIVFIYVGLVSDRTMLRLGGGFTFLAILWLALGEPLGLFTTVPLFPDPMNLFHLSTLTVPLVVAFLAVDLLSSNMRRSLEQSRQDLAQRVQAEQSLRESEQRLRKLFQLHAAAQLIIDPDSGKILDANNAAAEFYGWSTGELTRMSIHQINVLPADAVNRAMEKAASKEQTRFEFRHRRADGSIRDVEVFSTRIETAETPLLYSIIHDVTERKRAEELLRQAEERYRLMFESAPLAINITRGTDIIYANPSYLGLFGFSSLDELRRVPPLDLFAPEWREQVRENIQHRAQGRPVLNYYEVECLRRDGTRFPILMYLANAIFADGPATVAFTMDITARREAEEALRQAQKMETIGQLAGGVAHDFNNMLQVIISYSEMALEKVGAAQPQHGYIGEVLRAAHRSADFTGQLLAFARKQTVNPRVLDLNGAVANARQMIHRMIGEEIELAWLPGRNVGKLKIDPAQVDQILANLAANARDAIGGVGTVTIQTERVTFSESFCAEHSGFMPGDFAMLAVADDGSGMDRETQQHLFEPFYTTKKPGKGTGLGLATVYGIVKQNNGFIITHSNPGEGTTFRVFLPRAEEAGEIGLPEARTARQPGGTETVLVVEDEPAIRELVREGLAQLGYKVFDAGSPVEAVRMSAERAGQIQLLITDVVMPQMNGRQLAERISAESPGVKCLYMSGYTQDVIAHRGVLEGGMSFIAKPFTVARLAAKVREVLDA
jgi:two-component system, cell cycle sensor histidine kinase and response regulator CckA